jgi:tripartite ATP-independent transporter DctM subunit
METAGLWMLAAVAALILTTGLPAWVLLVGVALGFATLGVAFGAIPFSLLTSVPSRFLGLLENDLLQTLPLYVLMGAMLNRLPLADVLFRTARRALRWTGAGAPLAGLGLGVLLAPMNGSVGASAAMLARTVLPRLSEAHVPRVRAAALVCVASTLGVVVPPSLVLILLGDAMLRAHTEAVNATGVAVRIVNTQDVFRGALVPAAVLLLLCALVAWRRNRRKWSGRFPAPAPAAGEWITATVTALVIVTLLAGVTLGYLYAVEAAATGGVALCCYGVATRTLTRTMLAEILRDTMAITGALFALLIGATVFTLVVRAFGTDRLVADWLSAMGGDGRKALFIVLLMLGICAFVLDAYEMIFVVIPIVMPPLLMRVPDATWVAVLTLLVLQTSFLVPPMGYAVLMVRHRLERPIRTARFLRALSPYLVAQLLVLAMVLAYPASVWRGPTADARPEESAPVSDEESGQFERPQEFDELDTSRRETPLAEPAPSDPDKQ